MGIFVADHREGARRDRSARTIVRLRSLRTSCTKGRGQFEAERAGSSATVRAADRQARRRGTAVRDRAERAVTSFDGHANRSPTATGGRRGCSQAAMPAAACSRRTCLVRARTSPQIARPITRRGDRSARAPATWRSGARTSSVVWPRSTAIRRGHRRSSELMPGGGRSPLRLSAAQQHALTALRLQGRREFSRRDRRGRGGCLSQQRQRGSPRWPLTVWSTSVARGRALATRFPGRSGSARAGSRSSHQVDRCRRRSRAAFVSRRSVRAAFAGGLPRRTVKARCMRQPAGGRDPALAPDRRLVARSATYAAAPWVSSQAFWRASSMTSAVWAPDTPKRRPRTKNGTPRTPMRAAVCSSARTSSA